MRKWLIQIQIKTAAPCKKEPQGVAVYINNSMIILYSVRRFLLYNLNFITENHFPQYFLSKLRYCTASRIWSDLMISLLSRSAIVLATLSTLS